MAAFRSRFPYVRTSSPTFPAAIRSLITRTAEDRGAIGFDFDYGYGIINGKKLATVRTLTVTEPEAVVEEISKIEEKPALRAAAATA